jgi:hypothetical protein
LHIRKLQVLPIAENSAVLLEKDRLKIGCLILAAFSKTGPEVAMLSCRYFVLNYIVLSPIFFAS